MERIKARIEREEKEQLEAVASDPYNRRFSWYFFYTFIQFVTFLILISQNQKEVKLGT